MVLEGLIEAQNERQQRMQANEREYQVNCNLNEFPLFQI